MKIKHLVMALAAVMGLAFASCEKGDNGGTEALSLNRTTLTMIAGDEPLQITATYGSNDVTSQATWASDDEAVATVNAGAITPVGAGTARITCTYNEATATCVVTVGAGSSFNQYLEGSDYYIFQMDDASFEKLGSKVTSDMRPNGSYNDDGTLPEGVTRPIQIWNPSGGASFEPTGLNCFGQQGWFSAKAQPAGSDDWDNICGGLATVAGDTERDKIKNLTPGHKLVVILKGNYTVVRNLQIAMTPPEGGNNAVLFDIQKSTGVNADGDWEAFELTYAEVLQKGVDLSKTMPAEVMDTNPDSPTYNQMISFTWFPYTFTAYGGDNTVEISAAFFYVPAK